MVQGPFKDPAFYGEMKRSFSEVFLLAAVTSNSADILQAEFFDLCNNRGPDTSNTEKWERDAYSPPRLLGKQHNMWLLQEWVQLSLSVCIFHIFTPP